MAAVDENRRKTGEIRSKARSEGEARIQNERRRTSNGRRRDAGEQAERRGAVLVFLRGFVEVKRLFLKSLKIERFLWSAMFEKFEKRLKLTPGVRVENDGKFDRFDGARRLKVSAF